MDYAAAPMFPWKPELSVKMQKLFWYLSISCSASSFNLAIVAMNIGQQSGGGGVTSIISMSHREGKVRMSSWRGPQWRLGCMRDSVGRACAVDEREEGRRGEQQSWQQPG